MKKISSFLLIVFLLAIFVATPVSATTSAGIKPSSFLYFFDTTFEKVNLFFTFNPEKKAKKALEYADERLAEVETLTDNKDSNMVKAVMENYTANIALASEKSKEVKDQQVSENLLSTIADSASKNQEVLNNVLAKVPEEAKDAILKAIEASKKEQEEATKQIAELKGEVEKLKQEVAELKQEKTEKSNNDEKAKFEAETTKAKIETEKLKSEVKKLETEKSAKNEAGIKAQADVGDVAKIQTEIQDLKTQASQQIQIIQNQQTTLQQIQQNTQQIQQNTQQIQQNTSSQTPTSSVQSSVSTLNCNNNYHLENSTCVLNITSCSITNGIGEKTYSGSSWGSCTVVSCNSGFEKSNNNCVQILYFVAEIQTDKDQIANDGIDKVIASIITKNNGGEILTNKTVSINGISHTSDLDGLIKYSFTTTNTQNNRIEVVADGRSYYKNLDVFDINKIYKVNIGLGDANDFVSVSNNIWKYCGAEYNNINSYLSNNCHLNSIVSIIDSDTNKDSTFSNIKMTSLKIRISGIDSNDIKNIKLARWASSYPYTNLEEIGTATYSDGYIEGVFNSSLDFNLAYNIGIFAMVSPDKHGNTELKASDIKFSGRLNSYNYPVNIQVTMLGQYDPAVRSF